MIREWSPFINKAWLNKSDLVIDQRRSELNLFFAPDKEVPTFLPHKCKLKYCLLNIHETYNGNVNQIKGINYLEKRFKNLILQGKSYVDFSVTGIKNPEVWDLRKTFRVFYPI